MVKGMRDKSQKALFCTKINSILSRNSVLNFTSFGFASHFADELVSTACVGHVYFQCDEIRSSSALYRQNLSYVPEIKL